MRNMKVMKNKKIQIALGGEIYEVSNKCVREYSSWSGKQGKYIYISHADAGSLVRQYVKKKYKGQDVMVKVSSSSFAGGNSLGVYVHDKLGRPVEEKIYRDIEGFAHLWEYGKFNGMEDIYDNYESSGAVSDNGNEIQAGVKYVSVHNRSQFGSMEAILYEVIEEGRQFSEVVKYYTDSSTKKQPARAKEVLVSMGIEVK
jgi:hypothetical protein